MHNVAAMLHAWPLTAACLIGMAGAPRTTWAVSLQEVAAQRQESLDDLLSPSTQPALIANGRKSCAAGGEPARVAESRAGGAYFTPDAADGCVALLKQTARDGRLPELYRTLLTELGGDVASYERLPRATGAAVLNGSSTVPIGHQKTMTVTPALAFDTGFTVAYQEGSVAKPAAADPQKLKILAEACLSQRQDAATCFSAGYVYGGRAFTAQTAVR